MTAIYQKPALTFSQQLKQLKRLGLTVSDDNYALLQLSTINYYRLSAYWYPFRIKNQCGSVSSRFTEGAHFDHVIMLYEFDRQLRLLVIDAIERIEVYVRTVITYHFGHTYGAFGHANPLNFHNKFEHAEWLKKLEIESERSKDDFIKHYKNKYSGFPRLPIWMMTEVMSFGNLSIGYKGLKNEDKRIIASQFGLHYKCLANWLHVLTYIRNICTHHSRLWNRELIIHPDLKYSPDWQCPKDRIFYILLMLRYLLKLMKNGDDWYKQCRDLIDPIATNHQWHLSMGLPENWKQHSIWM